MDYTKEDLIKQAIKKMDMIDELVESCQNLLREIYGEKETARYLLYLSCEKEEKNISVSYTILKIKTGFSFLGLLR